MNVLRTESFLYFDITFFWSQFSIFAHFLILLKDFLINRIMWNFHTDFHLSPESVKMVRMTRIEAGDLRGRNNFFINMICPKASSNCFREFVQWQKIGWPAGVSTKIGRPARVSMKSKPAMENISPCDHFPSDPSSFGHLFKDLFSFENAWILSRKVAIRSNFSSHVSGICRTKKHYDVPIRGSKSIELTITEDFETLGSGLKASYFDAAWVQKNIENFYSILKYAKKKKPCNGNRKTFN